VSREQGPAPPVPRFGIWLATALVVGNIIGSAIFMLPASLAPFGWNAVAAWVITMAGALCLAWVFAELARHLPAAGGAYGFMRLSLGEGPAFLGAWGYIVSMWAANAAIAIAGVSYLTRLVPPLARSPAGLALAACGSIWLLTAVNLRGLRAVGSTQLVSSIVKLLPFGAVIVLAIWWIVTSAGAALPPLHAGSVTLAGASGALGLTLYAMLGLESAAVPADAVENPARIVPLATMAGTALRALVSLVATCAVALMLPPDVVQASKAPVSDFVARFLGDGAGAAVAVCAVVSCLGCLNGWLLLCGQLPAAMAEAGTLPAWFGARNVAAVPGRPIVLGSAISTLLTVMAYTKTGAGVYNFVILISTATNLVMYLLCAVAVIRFMNTGVVPRSMGLLVPAVGALVFVMWAFYGTGWESVGWGAALIAAGWPLFVMTRRMAPGRPSRS
jgi:APA family basic amino acid/polyamine antiporter